MYFVPDTLIKYIAESIEEDKYRLKFNWCNIGIRLKKFYCDGAYTKFQQNLMVTKYNISSIKDIKNISNRYVDGINLGMFDNKIDQYNILEYLKDFKYLTHLELHYHPINDITPLKELTNLTHLTFGLFFKQDISILKELKNLTYLTFGSHSKCDITPLKDLKNLTHLELHQYYLNITPLQYLTNLKYLYLETCVDITPLQYLTNLKYLYLGTSADITPLKYLKNLTHLIFSKDLNQDITPLKYLKNLTHLIFSKDFNQDITPLKYLKNLTHLEFRKNFYQNMSPLKELNNLKCLKINFTTISKNEIEEKKNSSQLINLLNLVDTIKNMNRLKYLSIGQYYGSIELLDDINLKILEITSNRNMYEHFINAMPKNTKILKVHKYNSSYNETNNYKILSGAKRLCVSYEYRHTIPIIIITYLS